MDVTTITPSILEKRRSRNGSLMAATLVLRNLVMVLREKGKVLENTHRQLRHKEKGCDELKDQCLALRLENNSPRYIMLCQDCRHYLDSKIPEDTQEEYCFPSCIGVAGPHREFPKDTYTEDEARKRNYYKTWPDSPFYSFCPVFCPFDLCLALFTFVWPF